MRRKNDRTSQILEALTAESKLEVSQLAEILGVSQVTVRKDLDDLEKKNIIRREHGFAVLSSEDDLNNRLAYHYEEKKKIAQKAASLVEDGETVMIENGSCCALLAEELAASRKNLTIITNSAFIAEFIRGLSDFQIVLLGGVYQHDSQVMVGPMVRSCAENFFVDKFFIGTDGYSSERGFTNRDQMRAQAVRDMAGQAERVIVLTESTKFSKKGIVPLNLSKGKITHVITDGGISGECAAELAAMHIEVL